MKKAEETVYAKCQHITSTCQPEVRGANAGGCSFHYIEQCRRFGQNKWHFDDFAFLTALPPVGLRMPSSGLHYRRSHSFSKQTLLHLGSMNILCKLSTENHQCPKEISK